MEAPRVTECDTRDKSTITSKIAKTINEGTNTDISLSINSEKCDVISEPLNEQYWRSVAEQFARQVDEQRLANDILEQEIEKTKKKRLEAVESRDALMEAIDDAVFGCQETTCQGKEAGSNTEDADSAKTGDTSG
ncbi:hypothetical protein AB6A40_002584 [Gnathostoma spinigerum]|uniref:Geminin n=1 Tax=Gnathostoma spinigerum TaxID=75299 RepID=A0ABD6E6Z4_9BILA